MRLPANPSVVQRYAFGVAVSVVALVITLVSAPLFLRTPFLFFFPAVVVASWYGGIGPGLAATVLAIVFSDIIIIPRSPTAPLSPTELAPLVVFGGVAVFVSWLYSVRQRSQEQLAVRLETLSAINTLSETLNRRISIEEIYEAALTALEKAVGADRSSILLFDDKRVMQFVASHGLSEGYKQAAAGHSPWNADTRDPQPVLVPDVQTDSSLHALSGVILQEGIRALAFIPLVSNNRLLGKFMVYYNTPHVFTSEQVQAAETIARHITFALERRNAEGELARSRDQLEIILHGITDGITVQQPDGTLIYANDAAARIIGFDTPAELLATPTSQVMQRFNLLDESGHDLPLSRLPGRLALQGQHPPEQLLRFRLTATGEERWSVVNSAPVFDAQGKVLFAINIFRDFTERRRAEDAERAQRELLQVTLTSIGDAVIATDVNARVTFMNPIAEELTGWSQAEAQGHPLTEVFHIISEDTRQVAPSPATRVLAEGAIVGLANHTLLMKRDGTELPIDDSGAPIRDAAGSVIGVVLAFRDVTRSRQAQRELGRLAAIVESSEDAIHGKTLDAIITSWNRAAERLYGYSASEMIGQSAGILMPPARMDELHENMAHIKNGQPIPLHETLRRNKDGRLIDVLVSISPVRDNEGNIVGASTIARDITESKRARAELARLFAAEQLARREAESAQQRLEVLAEASHILSTSLDYETTLANVAHVIVPQFADWCSVSMVQDDGSIRQLAVAHADPKKEEFIHELQRRFPPDPNSTRGLVNVIRTGKPEIIPTFTDEMLVEIVKDPELLQIIRELGFTSSMSLPLIARGRVVGGISFAMADSGRHYTDDDLATARDLARRAATAIDNSRLYRRAEAAIAIRDQFLTLASHELKTPITSVMGFAELLQRRTAHTNTLTERDHRALELIYAQSVRLSQLINSMLDLSRIEAGQFSIDKAPVDLNALTRSAVSASQISLERHTLTYNGPDEPLVVSGDELRLEQMLQNLLQNAIKYSPHGGPITVELAREGDQACLAISDHGIGIPEEVIPSLFTRFFRADNVQAYRIGGMGIGLYVVKQIVTSHGGTIDVTSHLGDGTTFRVYLPLEQAAQGMDDADAKNT